MVKSNTWLQLWDLVYWLCPEKGNGLLISDIPEMNTGLLIWDRRRVSFQVQKYAFEAYN